MTKRRQRYAGTSNHHRFIETWIALLHVHCSSGIEVRHMWGMTELSPVGSIGLPTGQQLAEGMSTDDMLDRKVRNITNHCSWLFFLSCMCAMVGLTCCVTGCMISRVCHPCNLHQNMVFTKTPLRM
jgi:hypothetical protein